MEITVVACSNCNKLLLPSERDYCERTNTTECQECIYHELMDIRTIGKYNTWLRKNRDEAASNG